MSATRPAPVLTTAIPLQLVQRPIIAPRVIRVDGHSSVLGTHRRNRMTDEKTVKNAEAPTTTTEEASASRTVTSPASNGSTSVPSSEGVNKPETDNSAPATPDE